MTAPAWCDVCSAPTEFEPDGRAPYFESCTVCGHLRVERTRPARLEGVDASNGPREAW